MNSATISMKSEAIHLPIKCKIWSYLALGVDMLYLSISVILFFYFKISAIGVLALLSILYHFYTSFVWLRYIHAPNFLITHEGFSHSGLRGFIYFRDIESMTPDLFKRISITFKTSIPEPTLLLPSFLKCKSTTLNLHAVLPEEFVIRVVEGHRRFLKDQI